jgi:hypothetical protein
MAGPATCGCCGGIAVSAPSASFEPAGLDSVTIRTGTYWSFRDSLLARLTSAEFGPLADLKSRDPAVDFSIALIDAWATAGDVLSFYNERLASETLLGTARERLSLLMMAELVGYAPGPGVAASAKLAFTLSTAAGSPARVDLPSGIKVQSTPGPDEKPVLFETSASMEMRPAWNAMRPRLGAVQPLLATTSGLYLASVRTGLKAGDALFFTADDGTKVFARITAVTPLPADPAADPDRPDLTRLTLIPLSMSPLASSVPMEPADPAPGYPPEVDAVLGAALDASELTELLAAKGIEEEALFEPLAAADAPPQRVLLLRASAGTFGRTAPPLRSLPAALTGTTPVYETNGGVVTVVDTLEGLYFDRTEATWADKGTLEWGTTGGNYVFLDRVVEGIAEKSTLILADGAAWGVYRVEEAVETAVAEFAITGKSSRLKLDTKDGFDKLTIRGTTAWAVSEWIDLPLAPVDVPIRAGTTTIALEGFRPGLQAGQLLAVTGTLADGLEAPAAEHTAIASVTHLMKPGGGTTVTLAAGVTRDFNRRALRINANIAPATHGETRFEILGSGGSREPYPTFKARQGPLTHVSADTPRGVRPELMLRVNGIAWKLVPDLLDAASDSRVFTIALDEAGKPQIGFGNGIRGAMPAAGQDNITLDYRIGLGFSGRVRAGQLNMLMSRPLGLEGVTNPLPSEGGAGPEDLEDLRVNLPGYCKTLDRVVSLDDFAAFALNTSGIGKARAERVKVPGLPAPAVAVTVAGEKGAAVPPAGDLYGTLHQALTDCGIPFARFMLRDFRLTYFRLGARIVLDADYLAKDVLAAAEAALRTEFGFEARDFAQTVYDSQIITVLQQVPGVSAVLLDRLYTGSTPKREAKLPAARASVSQGAELILLHPGRLDYLEAAA